MGPTGSGMRGKVMNDMNSSRGCVFCVERVKVNGSDDHRGSQMNLQEYLYKITASRPWGKVSVGHRLEKTKSFLANCSASFNLL